MVHIAVAVLFGIGVLVLGGGTAGAEHVAGGVTEKPLSVDDLFVSLVTTAGCQVPRADQREVLPVAEKTRARACTGHEAGSAQRDPAALIREPAGVAAPRSG